MMASVEGGGGRLGLLAPLVLELMLCADCSGGDAVSVRVAGSYSGVRHQEKAARAFMSARGNAGVTIEGFPNRFSAERMAMGGCEVMMFSGGLSENDQRCFAEAFGKDPNRWPRPYVYGQYCNYIVVNRSNPIDRISYSQLRDIFEGRATTWDQVGQPGRSRITVIWERRGSKAREIFQNEVVRDFVYRKDFVSGDDCFEIAAKVAADRNAIGFCLYRNDLLDAVKVLSVGRDPNGPFYLPTAENVYEKKYPLVEDFTLYLHPNAPPAAKAYCEFACGPKGAEFAREFYLFPEIERQRHLAAKRLSEAKAGKGARVTFTGPSACAKFIEESAAEYRRASGLAQAAYSATNSDLVAIGTFVSEGASGKEALLLEDRPSDKALGAYGKRWNDLNPAEYVFAGRAAAIVVNAGNELDSLTPGQVQSVFSGEAKDWGTLRTGSTPLPVGRIARYGVPRHEAAARIFYKECVPAEKMAAVTTKKDTADVLAAVAADSLGIALVDLAALPANPATAGVKVLAIGPAGQAIAPSAESIKSAMYPFSQRLFLYVHPKASDTAKDFARFIATCGQSEASPYTDTVKAVAETYRKHGLIPLAVVQPARGLLPTSVPARR